MSCLPDAGLGMFTLTYNTFTIHTTYITNLCLVTTGLEVEERRKKLSVLFKQWKVDDLVASVFVNRITTCKAKILGC